MIVQGPELFGSEARTKILVALALLGETYPRELARIIRLPLVTVQRNVNHLDREGVTASRVLGTLRQVRLNPSYFARDELATLLSRLAQGMPALRRSVEELRRRPRRAGKSL